MRKSKISLWYDEDGDYLEVLLKKSKETYFNEVRKDYSEIIDKKTNRVIGFAIFNFTKRKGKFVDVALELPQGA